MIELKTLSKTDAYNAVRGCELSTFKTQNMKWQRPIINHFTDLIGKRYKTEIQLIVTLACKSTRYNLTGGQISLDRKVYATVNKKRPTNKISYDRLRELLSILDEEKYIIFYKGFYRSGDDKMKSCIRFLPNFLDMISKDNCDRWAVSREDEITPLEVVDEKLSTKKKKIFKSIQHIRGSKIIKDEVILVNRILSKTFITFRGEPCAVVYKRRFIEDLVSGGRWYVIGTFQTEDSDLRCTIEINHEPCVEVDYETIHPSVLATLNGINLPDDYDPYDISHLVKANIDKSVLRKFIKPCFMALLYADNRSNALHEIRQKLFNSPEIYSLINEDRILSALEEHNHILRKFFYTKDNWKLLQGIDSKIATSIMMHFYEKGEVCLCYHDSFVVSWRNKKELIEVMKSSWLDILGNNDNFGYDIEFDNTPLIPHKHPSQEVIPLEAYL